MSEHIKWLRIIAILSEGHGRPLAAKTLRDAADEFERLDKLVEKLARRAALAGVWSGDEPEGQGLPDGETWAHYQACLVARQQYEELTGKEWSAEAAEAARRLQYPQGR